jgi:hypothetical protein
MALNTPTFRKATGSIAMTGTYNTIVYDYFPLVSVPNRPIYWDARYSMEWASGKVSYEHNKLLSSGIGMTAVELVTKRVLGGSLVFKKGRDTDVAGKNTDKIREVCCELNLDDNTERLVSKGNSGGSSFYVLSPNGEGLVLDTIDMTQGFISFAGNKVQRARLFINFYDDNYRGIGKGARYFLIEDRYFEKGKPYTINRLYKSYLPKYEGATDSFDYTWRDDTKTNSSEVKDEKDIPDNIKEFLEDEGIVLGLPVLLPFKSLGIFHFPRTANDLRHPNSKYGRPLLSGCYDLLWSYDFAFSILAKDLQVGRALAFVPTPLNGNQMLAQQMGDKELGNAYYQYRLEYPALFDDEFVKVPHMKMDDQMPSTVQFDIRAEKIKTAMDKIASMIANQIGISPTYFISMLNNTNETKTATEVASDMSETNLTVINQRRLLQNTINELIDEICYFHGINPKDVYVTFSPLEELNKMMTADYIAKLRAVDGMSDETLVNIAYKDMSEAEKEEEVKRIKEMREEKNNKKQDLQDFNNKQRVMNGKEVKPDENKVSKSDDNNKE